MKNKDQMLPYPPLPCVSTYLGDWGEEARNCSFPTRHLASLSCVQRFKMAGNSQQSMETGSISSRVDVDNPPFSRIFIVCSKKHTSDDMKAAFEQFGGIEDIWVVKDKHTKENRGVCYIKFAKASSAARACEEMDGKVIGEDLKPIKVRQDSNSLTIYRCRQILKFVLKFVKAFWQPTNYTKCHVREQKTTAVRDLGLSFRAAISVFMNILSPLRFPFFLGYC